MPASSQTPEQGRERQELRAMLAASGHWPGPIEQRLDAFANEVLREDAEQQKAVPRTERCIWQGIADALNAAEARGMTVGIDLDGTLTDHNAWSVIWDRDTKQWLLAGYDAEGGAR